MSTEVKKSTVNFEIQLDSNNIPEKLYWDATDKSSPGAEATNAFSISIWDDASQGIVKLDLWNKDMTVPDMKMFCMQTLESMAETLLNATGDKEMAHEMSHCLEKLKEIFLRQHGN